MSTQNSNSPSNKKSIKMLESLKKERDCAVEMWNLAKDCAETKREEAQKWEAEAAHLAKKMDDMQRDYSDAIKLMERKTSLLEGELSKATAKITQMENELGELRDSKEKAMQLEAELENVVKDRDDLKTSLNQTKELLQKLEKANHQARDKVADALAMAQDALANEASITEEKARLEDAMSEILTSAEMKVAKEVEKAKSEMDEKVEELQTKLHTLTIEKSKVALENETIKAEYRLQMNQIIEKNKNLYHDLEEIRAKRNADMEQWQEERENLRKQISSLQANSESLVSQLRRRQQQCPDCQDQKIQVERYKRLAKKWEETSDTVTQNFEKYLKDAKEVYFTQQKMQKGNQINIKS